MDSVVVLERVLLSVRKTPGIRGVDDVAIRLGSMMAACNKHNHVDEVVCDIDR